MQVVSACTRSAGLVRKSRTGTGFHLRVLLRPARFNAAVTKAISSGGGAVDSEHGAMSRPTTVPRSITACTWRSQEGELKKPTSILALDARLRASASTYCRDGEGLNSGALTVTSDV